MNKETILIKAKEIFTSTGYDGLSMRNLAKQCDMVPSVLYHYFPSKEHLLEEAFEYTRKRLGKKRGKVPLNTNLKQDIESRVEFQLENAEDVTFILKYYFKFRSKFHKNNQGYVPKEAYTHIYEILEKAKDNGELLDLDLDEQAKVITHAINGFVLEYYPQIPKGKEKAKLVNLISEFIYRSISKNLRGGDVNGKRKK